MNTKAHDIGQYYLEGKRIDYSQNVALIKLVIKYFLSSPVDRIREHFCVCGNFSRFLALE
jgi:hypothetical protein